MEELILNNAKGLFYSLGLKNVSMDDIARKTGVSKKTIYKSFEDKNAIIQNLVSQLLGCQEQALQQNREAAKDAVDEVFLFTGTAFHTMAVINPTFFYELEKFFPLVWKMVIDHKQNVLVPSITLNLNTGMTAGSYRQELDIEFIAKVRVQQIATAFYPGSLGQTLHEGHELMTQLSEFYLHAITTEQGRKLITTYLNQNNEKHHSDYRN